jgi:hypothetical protein
MPVYQYKNTETQEEWEEFWSYDSHKQFLAENPHLQQVFSINIVGGTGDRVKTDAGFNDMLGRIARSNPTSPLADRYGDKGIRASKSRDAVRRQQKKHGVSTKTS